MAKQYFELIKGRSAKFWHVIVEGAQLETHFGRIGTKGQVRTKAFASSADSKQAADKLVKEKIRKGYQKVAAKTGRQHCRSSSVKTPTTKATSIRESWSIIEGVLEQHAKSTFKALAKPATDAQIARVERCLGKSLPADLVESLQIHNGLKKSYLDVNRLFNNEALLSTVTIAKHWKMMEGLRTDGHFEGLKCSITKTRKLKNDELWRSGWVPFTDSDGDGHYLDLDPPPAGDLGQVFYYYHDGSRPRKVIAKNYSDWLSKLANKLQKGRFEVDDGEIWID